MPDFSLIDFILCCLFLGIGFVAGAWLRIPVSAGRVSSDSPSTEAPDPSRQPPIQVRLPPKRIVEAADEERLKPAELREMMSQVESLAAGMRTEVHQHSHTVEEINDDLLAISGDSEGVARVIARLMEANRQLDSRLNEAENRLQEQSQMLRSQRVEARTDALTGLPNRRVFDEEIQRLFDEHHTSKRPSSLIMIDIDHFKKFNDQYGHQAGDACLREVGQVIRSTVRGIGGIVARYGGEEFSVLLPGTQLFDAKVASQRLNRAIEALVIEFEGATLNVTASLGVAAISQETSPAAWLGRADRALYAAKSGGRNCAYWHDGKRCQKVKDKKPGTNAATNPKVAEKAAAEPKPGSSPKGPAGTSGRDEFVRDVSRRLAQFRRKRQPLALILVCIDPVDGMPAEDHASFGEIQKTVSQILGVALREMDHVSQLAPNQFGGLLPTASGEDAASVAERARKTAAALKLKANGGEVAFTISCGVTEALEGDEADHLLFRAEACLTRAQEKGGDAVYLVRHECEWESPKRITAEKTIAS